MPWVSAASPTGVDLSDVLRVDFDWYNFSELGADIEFSMIGITNTIPEPGSAVLFLIGGIFLRKLRKKSLA